MVDGSTLKALWLLLAYLSSVAGLGWLALAMEPHWQQVRGSQPPAAWAMHTLRGLGGLGLLLSLAACLRADHVTMAALVWVMTLAAAALTVSFALSWRAPLLAPLAWWIPSRTPKYQCSSAGDR